MSDKSEDDVESNRVLEYYKKYSQNPDLSKYFTGPEAALIKKPSTSRQTYREPQERSNISTHVQVETTINIENTIISDVHQEVDIENKNVSPTSSISSHKKLEWDNGADIGYTNSYKLSTKKSASFPSLFPSLITNNKMTTQNDEKSISENIEDLRNMYHQLTFSSEMSCSPPKDSAVTSSSTSPPKVQISSDSSTQSDLKKPTSSSDSSNRIAYLQRRIGVPVANSTPNDDNIKSINDLYTETPLLRAQAKPKRNLNTERSETSEASDSQSEKSDKNSRTGEHSSSSKGDNKIIVQKLIRVQREINLCLTKPVSLECISEENKECANKLSQTSFSSELPAKCIQTDIVEPEKIIIRPDPINVCSPQTSKIEYVKYYCDVNSGGNTSLRSDESGMSKKDSSKKNQRKGSGVDKTQDIERENEKKAKEKVEDRFIESNDEGNEDAKQGREVESSKSVETGTSTSLPLSKKSNSDSVPSSSGRSKNSTDPKSAFVNELCEEENVLAEMISLNHSRDLNTDIKRSIDILQKLLKSKKYDRSTKKYYIKKIVQKIVESKYSDDSTTSSELFRPRKSISDKVTTRVPDPNIQNDVKLMDNIPWYPADHPKYHSKKKMKPMECKTTRTEIFNTYKQFAQTSKPSPRHDFDSRLAKSEQQILIRSEEGSSKRTSTSQDTHSSDVFIYKKNNEEPRTSKCHDQNWRNGKTCSEMLLEKRDKGGSKLGQGDYLLHVAKNEREHQLSWINNEIEHLVNLKTLLEKKQKPDSQLKEVISSLLKMKVEDMKVDSPFQEARNSLKQSSGDKEISSLDVVPSLEQDSSKSRNSEPPELLHKNGAPFVSYNQDKVQVFMCPAAPNDPLKDAALPKNCLCQSATCKCSQTATHEEKNIQCPAFKPCTCQTEQKEDAKIQCCCKADAGVACTCGQDSCQCKDVCQSKSSSSSSSSSSESFMSCVCCKKQKILKNLLGKIPLCDPCQQVQQKSFYPYSYSNPLHSCLCYSLIDKGTLFDLKNTLTELERLEIYQQYCEVLKNCKCCKKCGCECKLPKKFKNGCAYFLKLEDACPNKYCDEAGEEFDYEEYGEDEEEEEEVNYLPEVTVKVPNCRAPCARKTKKKSSQNFVSCPSVQSYLCTMKPEFVARAEKRRHILRNAALEREQNVDDRKLKFMQKVKFLNENLQNRQQVAKICGPYGTETNAYCVFDVKLDDAPKRVQPHVFKSFKEMKDLTRRRYLHLNEVRNKKDLNREKRLREANRILANTFTRRIQRSTLRGNVDIPPNVKVVTY